MNKTTYFYPNFFRISDNVSRAANDAFAGRMRPAGREFETPVVN